LYNLLVKGLESFFNSLCSAQHSFYIDKLQYKFFFCTQADILKCSWFKLTLLNDFSPMVHGFEKKLVERWKQQYGKLYAD